MADGFGAEELEDGELWLPSDFFSMVDEAQLPNKTATPFRHSSSSSKLSRMAADHHRLSPSPFLRHHPLTTPLHKPPPIFQRFKPAAALYGSPLITGGCVHDPCACGTGNRRTGCTSLYQHLKPVQTQVETFLGERATWAVQRTRFGVNRVRPGTGVFLPRVSSNVIGAAKNNNHHHHHSSFGKGQRNNINLHEFQLPPRKILLNRRQEELCGYAAAAEVRLPYSY